MSQPDSTIPSLAAAIAFGLARHHPFADGNKRIALTAADAFLDRNGYERIATEADLLAEPEGESTVGSSAAR